MSRRVDQVNSLLREHVGTYLMEHLEFASGTLLTVTRVTTSPDLHHASIYITVFPKERRGSVLGKLRDIRSDVNEDIFYTLSLKPSPKVKFVIDEVETKAAIIEELLDEIKESE